MYCCSTTSGTLAVWMLVLVMGLTPLIAFAMDAMLGDPRWTPHPVVFIGKMIGLLEKGLRAIFPKTKNGQLIAGLLLVLVTLVISLGLPLLVLYILARAFPPLAVAMNLIWCWQIIAAKSLQDAALDVERGLREGGLAGGREYLSMIVGRDTAQLDQEGIIKATVETVAENTTDGVIAPLIFIALGGAPLGFLYKAVNTLDSMVGYKNEKYIYFGRAAARLDDVVNFLPARLTALLIVIAAGQSRPEGSPAAERQSAIDQSWRIFKRDRKKHASPNSGQTEAAMAGALGVQLAGDATYFGQLYRKPTLGDPIRKIETQDIKRACKVMYRASWIGLVIAVIIGFIAGGYIYL